MKLSIITVNLNNKEELEKTILSVINQSQRDFEFLVIDGASTDGSCEVINKYQKEVDFWVSESDRGIYDAMNKGIRKAKGEYLLFLNSGDYLLTSQSIAKSQLGDYSEEFVLFAYKRNSSDGEESISYSDSSFEFLINGNICHQSVLHKRTVFEKIGLYNDKLEIAADYEFFLKAFYEFNCSFRFVQQELIVYNDIEGASKNTDLLKEERKVALQSVFDHRLVNVLENQSNSISDLLKFRSLYYGLMSSKSVVLALKFSKYLQNAVDLAKNLGQSLPKRRS